jgi:hypothetical protein
VTLPTIISALATLNKRELATVKAAVEQLLGSKARTVAPEAISLFDAVRVAGGNENLPYEALKRSAMAATWAKYAPEAIAFIETTWPVAKHKKVVRMGLERLLVALLVDDLKEKRVRVTVGALVRNLGRLPEVFRAEFPGYIENQLQHLVLKAMEKKE